MESNGSNERRPPKAPAFAVFRPPEDSTFSGKGFTLLEVMVAMAVIALVLVTVFRMNAQSVSMSETARFQSLASLLAEEKLVQALTVTGDDSFSDAGRFDDALGGYRWRIDTASVETLALGGDRPLMMTRIDVEIAQGNGPLRYGLRTYRVR